MLVNFDKYVYFADLALENDEVFIEAANSLGKVLAERKLHLVYGGGNLGLMGHVASTSHVGGRRVLGVIPAPIKNFIRETLVKNW